MKSDVGNAVDFSPFGPADYVRYLRGETPELPRRIDRRHVVREQGLGVDNPGARLRQVGKPGNHSRPVAVVVEERATPDPSRRHMVQHTGRIEASLEGDYVGRVAQGDGTCSDTHCR